MVKGRIEITISADYEGEIRARTQKLNRKFSKYGVGEIMLNIEHGHSLTAYKNGCKLEFPAIKVMVDFPDAFGGYYIVASAEKADNDELSVRYYTLAEQDVLDAAKAKLVDGEFQCCEHCGHRKIRTKAYVVGTPEGDLLRVGRGCLSEFVSHHIIPFHNAVEDFSDFLNEIEREGFDTNWKRAAFPVREVLACAIRIIDKDGYVSASDAEFQRQEPTARRVGEEILHFQPTDAELKLADQIIEWAKNLSGNNLYTLNLKEQASNETVTMKNFGLIVSAYPAWKREQVKKEKVKLVPYDGEGRQRDIEVKLVKIAKFYTNNTYNYYDNGERFIYSFNIENNDGTAYRLVWFTANDVFGDDDINQDFVIDFTVKSHDEYKGNPVTKINRVKIHE